MILVLSWFGCSGPAVDSPARGDVDGDGYTSAAGDCDDLDAAVHPGGVEHYYDGVDSDCDGGADEYDQDGDGALVSVDCDDTDPSRWPGAPELCDGVDDDCDGTVDEEPVDGNVLYQDADGDGFGAPDTELVDCAAAGDGFVDNGRDCDDTDPLVNPYGIDYCGDGVDTNCDGLDQVGSTHWYRDDDHDGYGLRGDTVVGCSPPAGYVLVGGDCDDADPALNPGAVEVCDAVDNDCDSKVDEGSTTSWYPDLDGDGYGDTDAVLLTCTPPEGYVDTSGDCDDADAGLNPGVVEVCDGVDQDCDGTVDDGVVQTWYADADGDGYGSETVHGTACIAPDGTVTTSGDCDDTDPSVHDGATELCDTADQDCDGLIDEDAGCAGDTGIGVQFYVGSVETSGGSWVEGSFGAEFYGKVSGTSLCARVGALTPEGVPSGCPDCAWAFRVQIGATATSGAQCDDLAADTLDFAGREFVFGFASAYDLYGDGSLLTPTVLFGYDATWIPLFYEDGGAYPDAWNTVTGDATYSRWTLVSYTSYRYATWYLY